MDLESVTLVKDVRHGRPWVWITPQRKSNLEAGGVGVALGIPAGLVICQRGRPGPWPRALSLLALAQPLRSHQGLPFASWLWVFMAPRGEGSSPPLTPREGRVSSVSRDLGPAGVVPLPLEWEREGEG